MLKLEQIEKAGGFPVIYADPPWSYSDRGVRAGTDHHYATMSLDAIKALPIRRLAARDAVLFLWATYPLIQEALEVMEAWGFTYKSIAFQWVKTYESGKPVFGLGHWTRGNTEPCFLATRGRLKRVTADVSQLIETLEDPILYSVRGRHSEKPAEVRDRISRLMGPELPSVELFARRRVENWECWGNEVDSTIDLGV